jgi:uncharacterized protein (TIGR03382 family)
MTYDVFPRPGKVGVVLTGLVLSLLAGLAPAVGSARPPPGAPATPRVDKPVKGEVLHTGMPVVAGQADPSTKVEVEVNGKVIGRVHADNQGLWSYTVDAGDALDVGRHSLVAYGVGPAQERSAPSAAVEFDIEPYELEVTGCTSTGGAPGLALLGLWVLAALRKRRAA